MASFRVASLACLAVYMAAALVVGQPQQVFDVTKYGAVADGKTENSKAFSAAWKDSCAFKGNATFLIPKGEFLLGPVTFEGPCTANRGTRVVLKGTLKAVVDLTAYPTVGWVEFNKLHELAVGGGGTLDGQGADSWSKNHKKGKNLPTSLRFNEVNNARVSSLRLVNSKGFHVNFHQCANIKATHLTIVAPKDSPNTDGIHIGATTNINITSSVIGTGDDCISIGPGATNVRISNITCGPGHGISVGSLGKYKNELDVSGVSVRNCSLIGTTNGLRVKTWPGSPASSAKKFIFEDIYVQDVANPIIIDQEYCPSNNCDNKQPSLVKITGVLFRRIRGTSKTQVAVSLVCSEKAPCDNVQLEDINLKYVGDGATAGVGDRKSCSATCSFVKGIFLGEQQPPPCPSLGAPWWTKRTAGIRNATGRGDLNKLVNRIVRAPLNH